MKRFLRFLLKSILFWIVAIPVFLLVRARFLPEVEIPILQYAQITANTDGGNAVSIETFERHLIYLSNDSRCETIRPERLRQYQLWGRPLPAYPLIITIDTPSRDLPELIEPVLEQFGYTAIVALPTAFIADTPANRRSLNGVPLLTWSEIREAEARGLLSFATATRNNPLLSGHENPFNEIRAGRTDYRRALGKKNNVLIYPKEEATPSVQQAARRAKIKVGFDGRNAVATVGPNTDLSALPRVFVRGGSHTFRVHLLQNSVDPDFFGELSVVHESGSPMPASIRGYRQTDYKPFVSLDVNRLENQTEYRLPVPHDLDLPFLVFVFDEFRVIPYFSVSLGRGDVIRDKNYRKPLFKDDGSLDRILRETDEILPSIVPDPVTAETTVQ